jgi:hypothetical protein
MTAWDLFIFVEGSCFVSFMLCPNHRHVRYNILFVSSELCTLIQSLYHSIIISSHSHISPPTLGHSTKAIHRVQLLEVEEGLGHQRWTSRLLRGIGSDHLRPDPVLSCTEAPRHSTRRRSTLVDKQLSCGLSLQFLCIRGLFDLIHTLLHYRRSRKTAPSERRLNTVQPSASGPPSAAA